MTKLYSPPSGHFPQELPGYCRFKNGVIRRDLQTLSDVELNVWGWDGPFYHPIGKNRINKEYLTPELIEQLNNDENYEYDELNDVWGSKEYDYDPEIHKVIWYSKERRFIILPKDEDSSEYEILYESGVVLPEIHHSQEIASYIPQTFISQPLPTPPPILWNEFKLEMIKSMSFNLYVANLLQTYPIIATSLPVLVSNLEYGKYDEFLNIWNILKSVNAPSSELLEEITNLCVLCNLPQVFINSL